MLPVKLLESNLKYQYREVKLPSSDGMLPVRLLELKFSPDHDR